MSVDDMNSNLDVRSKKRKKPRGERSKEVSIEFSNYTHKNTIENIGESSFTVNVENKQKSKKLKLTEDVASESVGSEVVPNEYEISLDCSSKKKSRKSQIMHISAVESINNDPILNENEKSLIAESVRKKKKTKNLKKTVDSTSESVKLILEQSVTSSNLLTGKEETNKSQTIKVTAEETADNKLTPHVENDSVVRQRKKKSVLGHVSTSNATDSKKSKKKFKKKKSKKKNDSKNSSSKEKILHNSDATSSRSEKAILYLETWKNDRNNWKFVKLTQLWLFKHMFDKTKVPNETFEILLEYLVDLKGKGKNFVVELCEGVIEKKEEMQASEEEDIVLECAYERARSILQYLQ